MVDVTPEGTPNPNAVKFTLDRPATEGRGLTFRDGSDPDAFPLGARIYALDGVTNVFATANFVSVTKDDDVDWDELVPAVITEIQGHFGS
jgi:Scaffold protein Nfu/NifU N terminal